MFKALRIVDAPGSPTFGEACAPWVFDLVASIFGAYEVESGRRLITEWFILIPKKNAKSTIAAGIMMTALILNWRASAEFSILAPTVEIANNSFYPARDMCLERIDEDLASLIHAQTHVKTLTNRQSGAMCKVLAADSNTVGGKKGVGTLVDELWLFGRMPDAENMLREATGGLASRMEGFTVYLSTQSDDTPAGVFKQMLQYARDVRDGKLIDNRFVPIIYEFPQDMIESGAHLKPENFWMVNPNLGYSVDKEFLERGLAKARKSGRDSVSGFLAKHANVEIGLQLRSDNWAGAEYWLQTSDPTLSLDSLLERSEIVTVGVDGGGLDDLLGLCVMGREIGTGRWLAWMHSWLHPIAMERRKENAGVYADAMQSGELTLVQHVGEDVSQVVDLIVRCWETGALDKVGLDPAGIGAILDALEGAGIPKELVVAVTQGWRLAGAIKTAERKLCGGDMVHAAGAFATWCVSNARIEMKGNAMVVTKQASGQAKIDPVMAMFNAAHLMSYNPAATGTVYDSIAQQPAVAVQ